MTMLVACKAVWLSVALVAAVGQSVHAWPCWLDGHADYPRIFWVWSAISLVCLALVWFT